MRRNLWAGARLVKRARSVFPRDFARTSGLLGWLCALAMLSACGGSAGRLRTEDPYGPRVAQCIDAPRGVSDAAIAHMLAVPPGLAVLGSARGERVQAERDYGPGGAGLFNGEAPARRAHVHGFRMDRSPVTNAAYAEIVGACGVIPPDHESITPASWAELAQRFGLRASFAEVSRFLWDVAGPPRLRAEHPMVLVSYDEAAFYCAWRGGRLPTDVEWERAARGQTGNVYPWGGLFDPFRANVALRGAGDTIDVGARPTGNTSEGFTDMGGHVLEWTSTRVPGRDGFAVVKGNGWDGRGGYGRGAASRALPIEQRDITLGFRCAM
jgi:formylglycine-generating enzyme required for sulfatase activity